MPDELTHLDLFSGIGGFALAAQACGFRTVGFCEIEPYAQQILKERFGAVNADAEQPRLQGSAGKGMPSEGWASKQSPRLHPDITKLNGADYSGVSLLTGGFPCQPFSVAGQQRGKDDDRHLWPEMCRVIAEARPCWIVGENVAAIVPMELDGVLSDLENLGYSARPIVIPACAVDARHRRDRVWILAHASSVGSERLRNEPNQSSCAGQRRADCAADCQPWIVADSIGRGQSGQGKSGQSGCQKPNGERQANHALAVGEFAEWCPEPGMGRVAYGIPHRTHRLKGLGNAIVPAVAEEIIRLIACQLRQP